MGEDRATSGAVPRSFGRFTAASTVSAAAVLVVLAPNAGWHPHAPLRFALLSVFVFAGELLPIPVPRRNGLDRVTISTAFAFALVLSSGTLPACAIYAAASILADLRARLAPVKILFNAAQYVLSLAAAGLVLLATGTGIPVALHAAALPAIALAGAAYLTANHVLAGTGAALLAHRAVADYLRRDLAFQGWTAGCLLALAPGVIASANATLALIPVAFVPMVAIFLGGRQAAINAYQAVHDVLTDLPNRVLLTEELGAAITVAERARTGVAVLIIDLDDFKAVNDTLGHDFGDRLLTLVAPRLVDALPASTILARLGGDEFAAVVEDVGDERIALDAAQAVLRALERPFEVDSLVLQVSGSVGVACYPQHGRSVEDLLRAADVALYCAKDQRSTYAVYAHEQDEYSLDRLTLAAQLRRGIERGELVVHYQPKIPLAGRGACGVEALVRWQHPQLGLIGPEGFIPLAEQTGLIKALTVRVLEDSLSQCAAWRAAGLDVRFSVNLSTRNLLDQALPATISSLLERYGVPPRSLQLEITESRIVADVGLARVVLEQLRTAGVTVAIDDFGTGFSSLSQLQSLPVDEIKIDRSFVIGMETDRNNAVLVRSIIELGRSLGLRVTAEGVESASVEQTLRELGCDFAQGYHVGRPLPAEECRRRLEPLRGGAVIPMPRAVEAA